MLHGMRAFSDGDTYIAVPGGLKVVDKMVSSSMLSEVSKFDLMARVGDKRIGNGG